MRDPFSRRGEREARREAALAAVVGIDAIKHDTSGHVVIATAPTDGELVCPDWLNAIGQEVWHGLVADITTAGVILRKVDSHAVAMAAYNLGAIKDLSVEEDRILTSRATPKAKAKAKYTISQRTRQHQQTIEKWLEKIGATPISRARMGIRQAAAKDLGPIARLLQKKQELARGA